MRQRALGLGVAIVVGAVLVSASGAATTKAPTVTTIDVSTRAAVNHYLRSIHVNPKGAVIQRGRRNYAGANCPGKALDLCEHQAHGSADREAGGQNRFACGTAKCVVVQFGTLSPGRHAAARASSSSCRHGQHGVVRRRRRAMTAACIIRPVGARGTNNAGCRWTPGGSRAVAVRAVHSVDPHGPASATGPELDRAAFIRPSPWTVRPRRREQEAGRTATRRTSRSRSRRTRTPATTLRGAAPSRRSFNSGTRPRLRLIAGSGVDLDRGR